MNWIPLIASVGESRHVNAAAARSGPDENTILTTHGVLALCQRRVMAGCVGTASREPRDTGSSEADAVQVARCAMEEFSVRIEPVRIFGGQAF